MYKVGREILLKPDNINYGSIVTSGEDTKAQNAKISKKTGTLFSVNGEEEEEDDDEDDDEEEKPFFHICKALFGDDSQFPSSELVDRTQDITKHYLVIDDANGEGAREPLQLRAPSMSARAARERSMEMRRRLISPSDVTTPYTVAVSRCSVCVP